MFRAFASLPLSQPAVAADELDDPKASARAGADWFRAVDLPRAVKEKIAHGNAARLLGIGPT